MKTLQTVDSAACSGCGICVAICPSHVFELIEREGKKTAAAVPGRTERCMRCGQCMAICTTGAVGIEGLSADKDFFELEPSEIDSGLLHRFLAGRRSVRVFKNEPVPREMLEKIVAIAALAPMGYTPPKIEIAVVSSRDTIERALPAMIAMYEKLAGVLKNPVARYFIRRELPPDAFTALTAHAMPGMSYRLPGMKEGKWDTITRGAPAMMLFHAKPDAGCASEDALIVLTYALLAAHSLGLGATAIGLVPPVVDRSKELKSLFSIPEGNKVHCSMILGYSKYRFKRGIRRQPAAVQWV
jgi:ferredoxin